MSYTRHGFGAYGGASNEPYFPFSPNPAKDDCGCGGTCGGCGHDHGMGLFDSMDPTTWGAGELIVAGGIGYFAIKLLGDAQTVGRAARKHKGKAAGGLGIVGLLALAGGAYYLYQKSKSTGLGDYQPQGYVNPQILVDPTRSAQIRIPIGWRQAA